MKTPPIVVSPTPLREQLDANAETAGRGSVARPSTARTIRLATGRPSVSRSFTALGS